MQANMQVKPVEATDGGLRVFATLAASYSIARKQNDDAPAKVHPCRTRSIALDRMVIEADILPEKGDSVYLNIPGLGLCSGRVNKLLSNGFVAAITLSPDKINELMPRLDWLKRYYKRDAHNNRRHPRHLTPPYQIKLKTPDGESIVTVYDLSCSGVALLTDLRPAIGSRLAIAGYDGVVARHFDGGVGVAFDESHPLDKLKASLRPGRTA